jgi:RNA polymerase sigma factor (sigma-70 family)
VNDQTDPQLLRAYAAHKSEAAFAAIVHRYVDLVFSAAFRMLGNVDAAKDVTQNVFVALAQNSGKLLERPALAGWLHHTARNLAVKSIRSDARRRTHEQRAAIMNEILSGQSDANWDEISPYLDEALGELGDSDRDALLLRYFKNHDLRTIGARLGISEDAAQKRVSRAVERLREFFARRGIKVAAGGLIVVISANAVQAAPAGLGASIAMIPMAVTAASGITTLNLLRIMAMTKLKVGIITAVVAAGITIPVMIQHRMQTKLNAANEQLRQQMDRNNRLAAENENLSKRATTEVAPAVVDKGPSPELLKLRGEVTRLRQENTQMDTQTNAPITHDLVEARYKHAQELARSGDSAGALKEFLWCFDDGMPRVTGYSGVRDSFLLSEIAKLGENYPPALAALRERRDAAWQRMLSSENDPDAAQDFASINRELHEDQNTLAAFDQLPADDHRRQVLASVAYDQLVGAQRYGEAILGKPYETINMLFDMTSKERPLPASITNPEMVRKAQRDYLINSTATSVEAFAGAGDLADARALATRLLAYDNSPGTVAVLQQHLVRAGQAGLLSNVTNN